MSFYSMDVIIKSKSEISKGSSQKNNAVNASAYITAEKRDYDMALAASAYISGGERKALEDSFEADYRKKKGVLFSDVILPEEAPRRLKEPTILWNEVEKLEGRRKDAMLYREFIACLSRDLSFEEMKDVAYQFANQLAAEGMAVEFALHDEKNNNGNFHVHFLCPVRGFENGEWKVRITKPRQYVMDDNGCRIPVMDKEGNQKKNADGSLRWKMTKVEYEDAFNERHAGNVKRWRKIWADLQNQYLPEEKKVSELSYAEQGIDKVARARLPKSAYIVQSKLDKGIDSLGTETKEGYLNKILSEVQKEYRRLYYSLSKNNGNSYRQLKEEYKQLLTLNNSYSPQKNVVCFSDFQDLDWISIERAFVDIFYFLLAQSRSNTQEQILREQLYIYNQISRAANDLLIAFSGNLTLPMCRRLEQANYDMKKEIVKELGVKIREVEAELVSSKYKMKNEGGEELDDGRDLQQELEQYREQIKLLTGTYRAVRRAGQSDYASATSITANARAISSATEKLRPFWNDGFGKGSKAREHRHGR